MLKSLDHFEAAANDRVVLRRLELVNAAEHGAEKLEIRLCFHLFKRREVFLQSQLFEREHTVAIQFPLVRWILDWERFDLPEQLLSVFLVRG